MRKVKLLQEQKARIRHDALARRDAMATAARAAASATIRRRLLRLPAVASARTLLAFAAFGSEVDLDPLLTDLAARGIGIFLPFVQTFVPPDMGIARVKNLDRDLAPSRLGIREPDPRRRRAARIDRIDVVIAPGVAFDTAGGRIGYGGGFYDRLLPRLRPGTPVIAVAFETQIVAHVPTDAHDRRVDVVVTEDRTIVVDTPPTQPVQA